MKALATNRLASSPQYEKILHEYNQEFQKSGGKVNESRFYREVVLLALPNYHIQSWYQFLRRFKGTAGLISAHVVDQGARNLSADEENKLQTNLLGNDVATRLGIQRALNIGSARLGEIMENPQLMTTKDAVELLFKAMKAQDSRIHAIGKIREDTREQGRFDRLFDEAAYDSMGS
ncbi:MAG: hypothetical protein WCT44_02385 [Candidatus Paceibacterota bacterium]